KQKNLPLLEVYNPIYSIHDGKIIAVAEFYQISTELEEDILNARLQSWLLVASVFLITFSLLFGIVRRGSNLIESQRAALEMRYVQLSKVSEQNDALRRRIQAASGRVSELNESYLKRISAELHDGPAQMLSFAKLRLDSWATGVGCANRQEWAELPLITQSLDEALTEIRDLCRGLSLPAIECKTFSEVVSAAVRAHEQRNGVFVQLSIFGDDLEFDHSVKICAYRFVQEGLNNAARHGEGADLRVSCNLVKDRVTLSVFDAGPGFDPNKLVTSGGLGLRGLRERIESHGGSFSVSSAPGAGTRLHMSILAPEEVRL
ncbi:MAG: sensor histidine kinase, partial [Rhodobacteraceae bacterium]|nr:sensor histidine kinase [Paracoccaceae bacterium]